MLPRIMVLLWARNFMIRLTVWMVLAKHYIVSLLDTIILYFKGKSWYGSSNWEWLFVTDILKRQYIRIFWIEKNLTLKRQVHMYYKIGLCNVTEFLSFFFEAWLFWIWNISFPICLFMRKRYPKTLLKFCNKSLDQNSCLNWKSRNKLFEYF